MLIKIRWYVRRLQVMRFREIVHRASESLYIVKCYWRHLRTRQKPLNFQPSDFKFVQAESSYFNLAKYFDAEKIALATGSCFLGHEWQWDDTESSWHFAPDTKRYWPKIFFSKIDYRQGNSTGDVRVTWEVSRFQHQLSEVVEAALSETISTEEKSNVFQRILDQIKSWWSANPFASGVNYISSMECALRLVAITHIVDIVRNELSERDWQIYLNFMEQHANFVFHRLSLHSSAGNHTIAEATGLVYAGALFPELKHADRWLKRGREMLDTELCRQINEDGGPLEQATWYLKFVVELGFLANEILARESYRLQEKTLQRLGRAVIFLDALSNGDSYSFEYGDSDHGYALSRALRLIQCNDSVDASVSRFEATGVELFDLELKVEGSPRVKIMFLTKNLGMAPLFAHGHADCLSACCAVNGQPMLIDTGTFGYNISNQWRRYFRSVHAHNTVSVNDLDQSDQLSNFQWSRDVQTHTIINPTKRGDHVYYCLARHSGFNSARAIHYRAIIVNLLGEFVVWDFVTCQEEVQVVANWHFATEVIGEDASFETTVGGISVGVRAHCRNVELIRESYNPLAGWRSEEYGRKHGIDTLRLTANGNGAVSLLTLFVFDKIEGTDAWWNPYIEELRQLI